MAILLSFMSSQGVERPIGAGYGTHLFKVLAMLVLADIHIPILLSWVRSKMDVWEREKFQVLLSLSFLRFICLRYL